MDQSFTTAFTVARSPGEIFDAVTNVRGWWSQTVEGDTDRLGAEFTYRHQDIHRSTQKVTELVPGRRVVWRILESHLSFASDPSEWTGTDVVFEIVPAGDGAELRFTHAGLVPAVECYGMCSAGWGFYINTSLRELLATGAGRPDLTEQ